MLLGQMAKIERPLGDLEPRLGGVVAVVHARREDLSGSFLHARDHGTRRLAWAADAARRTGSRRWASSSPTRHAASSTGTAAAYTTTTGRIRRRYAGKRWIACRLEFKGLAPAPAPPAREVHGALLPRRGHRLRRRAPALRALPARGLRAASASSGPSSIPARRAPTRSTPGSTRRGSTADRSRPPPPAPRWTELPDGAFVLAGGEPRLVRGSRLLAWTPAGYAASAFRGGRSPRRADHAAVAHGRPARRLGRRRAPPPLLGRLGCGHGGARHRRGAAGRTRPRPRGARRPRHRSS